MDEEPFLKDDDLKPCPFCGGEAEVSKGSKANDQPWWYIECGTCAAMCDSVEDWNKRTPVAEVGAPHDAILEAAATACDLEAAKYSQQGLQSQAVRGALGYAADAIRKMKHSSSMNGGG